MKHLLTAIACCLAVAGSAQTPYNPDSDGDGCITVSDVLGVLSLFDTCQEGSTMYYFRALSSQAPFFQQDILSPSVPFFLVNDAGEFQSTEDFAAAFQWALDHQGETFYAENGGQVIEYSVCPIDSVMNVSVPLGSSIPNSSIVFEQTEGGGYNYLVIRDDVNFPFADTPVFYPLGFNCGTPSALTPFSFMWNNEDWTLYEIGGFVINAYGALTFNVLCGY